MIKTMKQGALALALLSSVALFAAPAVANSLHDEGDFGGGYSLIGPSGGPERYDYKRHHTFRPYYYGGLPMATPAITMAPAFPCGVRAL